MLKLHLRKNLKCIFLASAIMFADAVFGISSNVTVNAEGVNGWVYSVNSESPDVNGNVAVTTVNNHTLDKQAGRRQR